MSKWDICLLFGYLAPEYASFWGVNAISYVLVRTKLPTTEAEEAQRILEKYFTWKCYFNGFLTNTLGKSVHYRLLYRKSVLD